jgi:hypothetical protein
LQANPSDTPTQVYSVMKSTAYPTSDVASLQPGASFITANPNLPISDPANTPAALINVGFGAVPEPSGLLLLGIASLMMGAGWLRCRR